VEEGLAALRSGFARDGDTGAQALALDWTASPIGPMEQWPTSLRTAVGIVNHAPIPMMVGWGPDLIQIYNDAFRPILGQGKLDALGRPWRETWAEIWDVIRPMLHGVLEGGEAVRQDDQRLLINRNGYLEEAFFTFSFTAVQDESGQVGGVFCAALETTEGVLRLRRGNTLRDLAEQGLGSRSIDEVASSALDVVAANPDDLPFAQLFLLTDPGHARAISGGTIALGSPEDTWDLGAVVSEGVARTVGRPDRPAVVSPLYDPARQGAVGVLVTGASPLRALDHEYVDFLAQVAGHVGTGLAAVRAYQAERERAEALAALDLAKSEFFSNVSHEFRTPLTLLLGPLDEALSDDVEGLGPQQRERVEAAERNAQRMAKLVNTLLDVSRAEAGWDQASFEATDLSELTAELASGFRSAVQRAGLQLDVTCPPLAEPVWVDHEMWEKVVLNLVSNALKFTFSGQIAVTVEQTGNAAVLRVSDTGTGIPADELPHMFDRFHRVRGARSRTHEGSGIGLALVRDLVALHGGEVTVASRPGEGSTFTVSLPLGNEHLPASQLRPGPVSRARLSAAPYVAEALPVAAAWSGPPSSGPRILVAEDNADMRSYLERLLAPHWRLEVVPNGAAALRAALADPPDLVVTDVMMPELDGLGLLTALRADASTRGIPVLMLSARAGDEASEEALSVGADDYLVKPFTQRQLVARVELHLTLARSRKEAATSERLAAEESTARREAARFASLAAATTDLIGLTDAAGVVVHLNRGGRQLLGIGDTEDLSGMTLSSVVVPDAQEAFLTSVVPAVLGEGVWRGEVPLLRRDGTAVATSSVIVAHRDDEGEIAFFATIARDMTEERLASERLHDAEDRFRHAFEDAPLGMAILDESLAVLRANPVLCDLLGRDGEELLSTDLTALVHPEHREQTALALDRLVRREVASLTWEAQVLQADGLPVPVTLAASLTVSRGEQSQLLLHVLDVTERQQFETQLKHLADHDPLTDLLNRRRLMELLDREVAAVHRYGGTGALLLIDLDDFKYVNDSLGHAAGDELILRTTTQLSQRLRETDTLARLGGDEFAVILPHVDEEQACEIATELLESLHSGAMIVSGSGARHLTASIGIAMFDQRRDSLPSSEELLIEADTAMYDAKEAGRARVAVFDPRNARQAGMEVRLDAAERLREALASERLVLHAQEIVPLHRSTVPHYELLVRVVSRDGTLMAPSSFLDVAERFHLILAIDRWVIQDALRMLAVVRRQGRRVVLSVNLSAQSIQDPDLPDWIAQQIEDVGVDGRDLVFEVTETDAAVNFERANALTRRLSRLGCGFALDDFGTGYCSLGYLKHLAFDSLKIDAEFMRNLPNSPADQLIVQAAVTIAHGLGKQTVAEGVEDAQTLALLRTFGVDHVQGFHFAVPAPASEVVLGVAPSPRGWQQANAPRHQVPGGVATR
jgi:diguanylate cyclase (GGDEF)-like protein/PAS domain S-box-containing protein